MIHCELIFNSLNDPGVFPLPTINMLVFIFSFFDVSMELSDEETSINTDRQPMMELDPNLLNAVTPSSKTPPYNTDYQKYDL